MDQIIKYIWLIPAMPLLGFLINGLFRKQLSKQMSGFIGSGVVLVAFVISALIFFKVDAGQTVNLYTFIKLRSLQINFDFRIDHLSQIFLLVITGVGFLIHVYSTAYMHDEDGKDFAKYFAYLNLFVFSMLVS